MEGRAGKQSSNNNGGSIGGRFFLPRTNVRQQAAAGGDNAEGKHAVQALVSVDPKQRHEGRWRTDRQTERGASGGGARRHTNVVFMRPQEVIQLLILRRSMHGAAKGSDKPSSRERSPPETDPGSLVSFSRQEVSPEVRRRVRDKVALFHSRHTFSCPNRRSQPPAAGGKEERSEAEGNETNMQMFSPQDKTSARAFATKPLCLCTWPHVSSQVPVLYGAGTRAQLFFSGSQAEPEEQQRISRRDEDGQEEAMDTLGISSQTPLKCSSCRGRGYRADNTGAAPERLCAGPEIATHPLRTPQQRSRSTSRPIRLLRSAPLRWVRLAGRRSPDL